MKVHEISAAFVAMFVLFAGVPATVGVSAATDGTAGSTPFAVQDQAQNQTAINLTNVTIERLHLRNVRINTSQVENMTVPGSFSVGNDTSADRTFNNGTASRLFVLNATLRNVTFENLTIRNRTIARQLLGRSAVEIANGSQRQNVMIENATLNGTTIPTVVIDRVQINDAALRTVRIQEDAQFEPRTQTVERPVIEASQMTADTLTVAEAEAVNLVFGNETGADGGSTAEIGEETTTTEA